MCDISATFTRSTSRYLFYLDTGINLSGFANCQVHEGTNSLRVDTVEGIESDDVMLQIVGLIRRLLLGRGIITCSVDGAYHELTSVVSRQSQHHLSQVITPK